MLYGENSLISIVMKDREIFFKWKLEMWNSALTTSADEKWGSCQKTLVWYLFDAAKRK